MAVMKPSEARRLLELPARGRVSPKRLKQAYEDALRHWTRELNVAVRAADRERVRDVLRLIDVAYDVLATKPGRRAKKPERESNRAPSASARMRQSQRASYKEFLAAYRAYMEAMSAASAFFSVPKPVVVLVFILATLVLFQSCARSITGSASVGAPGPHTSQARGAI